MLGGYVKIHLMGNGELPDAVYAELTSAGHTVTRGEPVPGDLLVTVFSREFVPPSVLRMYKFGGIGFHPSYLPKHRGCDAVYWQWRMRDPIGGGTVYRLEESFDTGSIIAQEAVVLDENAQTHHDAWRRIRAVAPRLVCKAVSLVESGYPGTPQDGNLASYEPHRKAVLP